MIIATREGEIQDISSNISELGKTRSWFSSSLSLVGVDLLLLSAMTLLLVVVVVGMGGHVKFFQPSVGFPLAIMATVIFAKCLVKRKSLTKTIPRVLRDWLPFVFISFIYENLYVFSKQVMSWDISPFLYRLDVILFGVEPTLWVQRFFSPWLTDIMAFFYALYFALPLSFMFVLSLEGRRFWLRHMVTALTFVFIIGFLCYILLPCNPPRYLIPHLYSHPPKLYGLFLYDTLQGAWDGMSVISGGAFPSLHVAISSIALLYGFRLRHLSRLFCILHFVTAPLVVGVWVATIYLRHHWVIDIVAGLVVAIVAMLLSQYALRWGMRKRLALPLSDS